MREKGNGHKPNVNSYDSAENEMCVCVCECGFLRFFENVETQVRKKGKCNQNDGSPGTHTLTQARTHRAREEKN